MIINFLLLLFLSFGFGALLPNLNNSGRPDYGLRALGGFGLLTCSLYVGIVLLSLGIESTLYVSILLAILGFILFLRQTIARPDWRDLLYHPVLIVPLAIVGVSIYHGPVHFTAYGDDTFINWLAPAKQMWLVDHFHDDRFISAVTGYLPGWHFLLAFTSPLWGNFSETRAIAVPTVLHVVLLAAAFDVITIYLRSCNLERLRMHLLAYVILLLLVTTEASWQLVPTLVLSEMPLFYSLIGLFLIGSLLLCDGYRQTPVIVLLSVILGAHYLIKTQGIAAVPIASAMAFFGTLIASKPGERSLVRSLSLAISVVAPTLIVFVSWKLIGPEVRQCASNVTNVVGSGFGQFGPESNWQQLAIDLFNAIAAYLGSYKFVVSLVAFIGLVVALFDRKLRWVSLAIISYFVVYLISVYLAYLSCSAGFNSYLSSLPRYLQLPIRLFHFVGLILLSVSLLRMYYTRLNDDVKKATIRASIVGVGILGAVQLYAIERSLTTLRAPGMFEMEVYSNIIPLETKALQKKLQADGLSSPKVLMVYSFHEHLPYLIGVFHGLSNTPHIASDETPLSPWDLKYMQFSHKRDRFPFSIPDLTTDYFNEFDVVWPLDGSVGLSVQVLALTSDEACATSPSSYFLFRSDDNDRPFRCVLKTDIVEKK